MDKTKVKVFAEFVNPDPKKSCKRFSEVDSKGEASRDVLNGTAYIPNDTLAKLGDPEKVRITVEAA